MPISKKIKRIFTAIHSNNFLPLAQKILTEEELKYLAKLINKSRQQQQLIFNLIKIIPNLNRNYDWNIGSILQHLDVNFIIDTLKKVNLTKLDQSIGLAWVLGEFNNKNRIIIDFLYSIVLNSKNSDAWWRAAFALEKLGEGKAINLLKISLKHQKLYELNFYLNNLNDKKSIICILILCNVDNIEKIIYPKIKKIFLLSKNCEIIINCCWLIGRFKLIDKKIYQKLLSLIKHNNYELKYYTFFALQSNATEKLRSVMEESLKDNDPLIRKMAARSLRNIGNEKSLNILELTLYKETNTPVISEISKSIYNLKNPFDKNKSLIKTKSYKNENGMIIDESDKWYGDPAIYDVFSKSEDPENICFDLITKKIETQKVKNPIDLATGTGRMLWLIVKNINFEGKLFGIDANENMCNFTKKSIKRERIYTNDIKIIRSKIEELPKKIKTKSNFIISSFGFPSKIRNKKLCLKELKAVYSLLSEDGVFFTIGWDETFSDELNMMWYKYIPDDIKAHNFEEWRSKRSKIISSARNCNLSWFKKGIQVPLQFSSLKESAEVMGYLFGKDAAEYVVENEKTEWMMRMGITFNTKKELKKIIKTYARN